MSEASPTVNLPANESLRPSRRFILSALSGTALAATAPAAWAAPFSRQSDVPEKEHALRRAASELEVAKRRWDYCSKWFEEWKRRDPKPQIRDCWVGSNEEYSVWSNAIENGADKNDPATIALDPNRDLNAAHREFETAMKAWGQKSRRVQNQLGMMKAKTDHDAAHKAVSSASRALAAAEVCTFDDLYRKAQASAAFGEASLTPVDEFVLMRSVIEGTLTLGAPHSQTG